MWVWLYSATRSALCPDVTLSFSWLEQIADTETSSGHLQPRWLGVGHSSERPRRGGKGEGVRGGGRHAQTHIHTHNTPALACSRKHTYTCTHARHNRPHSLRGERERESERDRQTDRQTDTERQRDRQRDRETQTQRQRHRETETQTERTGTRTRKLYFARTKTCLTTSPC